MWKLCFTGFQHQGQEMRPGITNEKRQRLFFTGNPLIQEQHHDGKMTAVDPVTAETLRPYMHSDHQGSVDVWLFSGGCTEALFHYGIVLCFLYRFQVSVTEMALVFAPCAVFWSAVGIGSLVMREGIFSVITFPVFVQTALKLCSQGCSSWFLI